MKNLFIVFGIVYMLEIVFLDEEFANICQCYYLYKIKKLPIILIFTQADNEIESDTIINYAQSRINEISDNNFRKCIKIVKVLPEDKPFSRNLISKAYGIYNLKEKTFHSPKEGIKSSLNESLKKEGVSSLREEFHKIIDNTRSELFQDNLDDAPALEFKENNQNDYKLKLYYYHS